ncbi:MAG: hypothetical protein KQH57_17435 [Actinomycetales bacterium]|nr:hypothetical protein [Actinomycetales bacterium]
MPLFAVSGGRPDGAHPVRPAEAAYGATVVDEHLGALLGEHLLPVAVRAGGADEPYLLAVDAFGRPVVVEVVGLLDGAALLRALAFLGRAARLSLRDLGARYRGGAQRFSADLTTFREAVPAARLVPDRHGARLLLVCGQVHEGLRDVVEALTDRGVDVLRVGLVDGPDGQMIDVSPVHVSAPDGSWTVSGGVATVTTRASAPRPAIETLDEDTVERLTEQHGRVVTRVPTGLRISGPAVPVQAPPPAAGDAQPAGGRTHVAEPSADTAENPRVDAPGGDAERPRVAPEASGASPEARRNGAEHPRTGPEPTAVDARLVALARRGPLALVWHRRRRGQTYEALLRADGVIELVDGTRVTDPSAAAEIASGAQAPVDGWRVWRVEDEEGPSLADAVALLRQPQP